MKHITVTIFSLAGNRRVRKTLLPLDEIGNAEKATYFLQQQNQPNMKLRVFTVVGAHDLDQETHTQFSEQFWAGVPKAEDT